MIVVPAWAWKATLDAFAEVRGSLARVAYLDGVAGGRRPVEGGVVTSVTLPRAPTGARGDVTAADATLAELHLDAYGLVRLAEVRTAQPAVENPRTPPAAPGAVAIVLPGHGLTWPGLGDAAVHVHEAPEWRRLDRDEVEDYVCVVPSRIDLRDAQRLLHL